MWIDYLINIVTNKGFERKTINIDYFRLQGYFHTQMIIFIDYRVVK